MYLSHHNLRQKPFQISPNPSFLWLGEKHREALAMMEYGILNNQGFLVLTGDVGTGKTTLINALVNRLGDEILVATIFNPRLDELQFLYHLAAKFNINAKFASKLHFIEHFSDFLYKAHHSNKKVLLIIDEAQNLSNELLEEIRLLSNFEKHETKLLNIFFVGQDEFNDVLMKKECRPLRQRITITSNIKPLTATETQEYINHRLKIAGCKGEIFTSKAIREVYAYSAGYPRKINIICDQALLTAYVKDIKSIKPFTIRECARELSLPGEHRGESLTKKVSIGTERKVSLTRVLLYISLFGVVTLNGYLLTSIPKDECINNFRIFYGQLYDRLKIPSIINQFSTKEMRKPELTKSNSTPQQVLDKNSKKLSTVINNTEIQLETNKSKVSYKDKQAAIWYPLRKKEAGNPVPSKLSALQSRVYDNSKELAKALDNPEKPTRIAETNFLTNEDLDLSPQDLKSTIFFNYNTNDIPLQAYESLDRIAAVMLRDQSIKISISGHTDSLGSSGYNKSLSIFRANIVKSYLVGKGIDPDRIGATGKGEENPLEPNRTVKGRRANRRVEIELLPAGSPQGFQ